MDKYRVKLNIIVRIVIPSSLCVLNIMLPTCRPNFAEVAHITYKADGPGLVDVAKGVEHRICRARLPHNLIQNFRSLPG